MEIRRLAGGGARFLGSSQELTVIPTDMVTVARRPQISSGSSIQQQQQQQQ